MHMKTSLRLIFSILSLFIFFVSASAQETVEAEIVPKTKLEAFQLRTGVVIIKGFSRIGTAPAPDGSSILVEAIEYREVASRAKEYGVTIEVREAGNAGRRSLSFIDYDEIEPLLKGLEYLSRIDSSVTQLNRFEADYRTRGEAIFSAYSSRGGNVTITVSAGVFRRVSADFKLEDLKAIRGLFIEAKNQLDTIQQK
jgi:hypothetical protein